MKAELVQVAKPDQRALSTGGIAVLGGGAVVRECFAPALDKLGLLDRTVIVDPRSSTDAFRQRVRIVATDFTEFLSGPSLDGITHCIVALPNALHFQAVTQALHAGLHVLCEKPLALRRDECEQLAALADRSGKVLVVNMIRRLFQSVRIAADVLMLGWLGHVQTVRISHGGAYAWPVGSLAPFERDNGGVLADMGAHYLDLAEMFVGRLTPVSYHDDYAGGVESDCEFTLLGDRDIAVEIALSRLRPLQNEIHIVGSAGTLRIGVDAFDRCIFEPTTLGNYSSEPLILQSAAGARLGFSHYFAEQLRRFFSGPAISSSDSFVGARDAARTASLIDWAYSGRRPDLSPRRSHAARLDQGGVLVTGATGFIGSHLVDRLIGDGNSEVTAGYHSLRSCVRISRYPVRYHPTDLLNSAHVRDAVRGQRYVFHLAFGRDEGCERPVTVQGTKNVIEASIEEGVEVVVVLSTMYVLGQPAGIVDETAGYRPIGGVYGATKAEMERWCLERAKTAKGTRIVVLLPTCVYGPSGRTYTEVPVSFAREGRFCWIDQGRGIANVVFVENLVDAMILAAITRNAHGQRFIINDDCPTWYEFLSPMLGPWLDRVPSPSLDEFLDLTAPLPGPGVRDVAASILRSEEVRDTLARTRVVNNLRPFLKKYAPSFGSGLNAKRSATRVPLLIPRIRPPRWLADVYGPCTSRFSSERAQRVLGWAPAISREIAIDRTAAWLRGQGLYLPFSNT